MYFLGPQLKGFMPANATDESWLKVATNVWRFIVRPIAVGGMLTGAAYTLFKMRKSLGAGLARAFHEMKAGAAPAETTARTERYMSSRVVLFGIFVVFALMIILYSWLAHGCAGRHGRGNCVAGGRLLFRDSLGLSRRRDQVVNNPISGLTLSTVIIAALLMVALGVRGSDGVIAVLGVAAVVCVSSAVAGELLQDFKVGYIIGGTPRSIQIVELMAVVVASAVMYFPLLVLHRGNINAGGIGFGDRLLPAPQAGLMASLSQGIVGGDMAWPLIVAGILMGVAMIMIGVKSPMLVAIGMYLPLGTTFAIFIGGMVRWVSDTIARRRDMNEGQKMRVESVGVLAPSGTDCRRSADGNCHRDIELLRCSDDPATHAYVQSRGYKYPSGHLRASVLHSRADCPCPHCDHAHSGAACQCGRPDDPPPPARVHVGRIVWGGGGGGGVGAVADLHRGRPRTKALPLILAG